MPIQYCQGCGEATKYQYEKPKKCASCDQPFSTPIKSLIPDIEDDDEPQPSFSRKRELKLKKIRVEVDTGRLPTLGEVMGSDLNSKREKRRTISKEEYKNKIFKATPLEIGE